MDNYMEGWIGIEAAANYLDVTKDTIRNIIKARGESMSEIKVIVIPDGKICDYIDGKFRNDTPEEYVRQTIEKRLVNEHKYLPTQVRESHVQISLFLIRAVRIMYSKI